MFPPASWAAFLPAQGLLLGKTAAAAGDFHGIAYPGAREQLFSS